MHNPVAMPSTKAVLPTQHALRPTVGRLLHERPFVLIASPSDITHLAWEEPADGGTPSLEWVRLLCEAVGMAAPKPGSTCHLATAGSRSIRWERHTEFSSLTLISETEGNLPFRRPVYQFASAEWIQQVPGTVLVALEISISANGAPLPSNAMNPSSLCTSHVAGGKAQVWTDFRHHKNGFSRVYISDSGCGEAAMGRLVQRLIEMEVYKSIGMHGFAKANTIAPRLHAIELELAEVTEEMTKAHATLGPGPVSELARRSSCLDRLLGMSAAVERIAAESSFRFSATRAYARIVEDRCAALREMEISGYSTLSEFIKRRFHPAVRTVEAVDRRREVLSRHLGRAVNLLNIQVNTLLEEQGRKQNLELERRSKRALHLQETVEGLSVIAISYYITGLMGHIFDALKQSGWPISTEIAKGGVVPIVVLAVWLIMKGIRREAPGT